MTLTNAEFETLLNDDSKQINCDISWQTTEYQRIQTPYLYPDGDYIDVFCKPHGDVTFVTDFGETTRWLRMQTISFRRSPKQQTLIKEICRTHGVTFSRGMLLARHHAGEQLSAVICRVARAALRISEQCFTLHGDSA